jgi:putative transposase
VAQSLSKILLHIVFSTKNREPLIDIHFQKDLYAYIAGTCQSLGCETYQVGGMDDHVHIACSLPRTKNPSDLTAEIKRSSSRWISKHQLNALPFAWQAGYGVFSLGQSQLPVLIRYIKNQQEHHKKISFQEEFVMFLKKYDVDYNEKYLWD